MPHRLKHKDLARASPLAILFLLVFCVFGLSLFLGPSVRHQTSGPAESVPSRARISPHLSQQVCQSHSSLGNNSDRKAKPSSNCNFAEGQWVFDGSRRPLYSDDCPFQRNAWNCGRNKRPHLDDISKWKWVPHKCTLPAVDPQEFLSAIRSLRIGFVGDSLNENFLVSLLCVLRTADPGAHKWKKRNAWRGAYFPKYNVTIGYHRAVLLAEYHKWQPTIPNGPLEQLGFRRGFQVNVDVPAIDWINTTDFYDIFVFNTGHWWGFDKFPSNNPLLFHEQGKPIIPPIGLHDGLKVVLQHMVSYMERAIPSKTLKIWRTQSPRHFEGGDWNQNGSCLSTTLLNNYQVEEWFGLKKGGVNGEARKINNIIMHALKNSSFRVLNVTYLSEFRAEAHPAVWLGQKNAHIIWGQDCMHWCLPGLPETWFDILAVLVFDYFNAKEIC